MTASCTPRTTSEGRRGITCALASFHAFGSMLHRPLSSLCSSHSHLTIRRLPTLLRRVVFGGTRSRQVVHRLALFDAGGHLSHVISQSDVIK